jgi:hypothetical protein
MQPIQLRNHKIRNHNRHDPLQHQEVPLQY